MNVCVWGLILHWVLYPRELGAQGRGNPEWGANPLKGPIAHTFAHPFHDSLEMLISLHACLWTGGGKWSTRKKTRKHGENIQTLRTTGGGGSQTPSLNGDKQAC